MLRAKSASDAKNFPTTMDPAVTALTIVNSILLGSPIIFSFILLVCLLVIIIKYIHIVKLKKQQMMIVSKGEKQAFWRKFIFIFMAFPMVLLPAAAQSAFIAMMLQLQYLQLYLADVNIVFIFSFACSFYISLLMLYISFLLLSTLRQIERIKQFEFICWNVIIVASLVLYLVCCIASVIISGLGVTTSYFPQYTTADKNIFKTFALVINYITFWTSYWICGLVLSAGIRFYLLIVSYSKKIANQMIVFLSILIVAALIQSFAALLPSFSMISSTFVILSLWIQRISELFFMIAFLLMYIPIQSVGDLRKVALEVKARVEKLTILNNKQAKGSENINTPVDAVQTPVQEVIATPVVVIRQE